MMDRTFPPKKRVGVLLWDQPKDAAPSLYISQDEARRLIEHNSCWRRNKYLIVIEKPEAHPQRLHRSAECDLEFRIITIIRDIIRRTVTDVFRDEYAENGYK